MKRIAVLLAAVAAAALMTFVASPAQAEECLTVPEVPGECLSPAVFNHITNLQATVFLQTEQAVYYRQKSDALWVDKLALQDQLAATVSAAEVREDALLARIVILRAKVKELRQVVRG